MNPSLAYVVAALNKSAAPPAQPVPFMQDPLLMGGVALGAMGGDSPQEMAIKGGLGYLAAKALKQWMEQNGQPVPEALKQNVEAVEKNEARKPSDARMARRNRNKVQTEVPAVISPPKISQPVVAENASAPVVNQTPTETPITSTRLRQDIAKERSGLGAIKRDILGSIGKLGPEDVIAEKNIAAKEQQLSDLYQKEQIDNIKMRENAARVKGGQLGLTGPELENYVSNKVPEVRTVLGKEAPRGQYYGSSATNAVNVNGKMYYRITDIAPGSKPIYTDHLGNPISDAGLIKDVQKKINRSTYRGNVPIRHESAEIRPIKTYNTQSPILSNKYKTNLGRGIGGAGGALLAGTAANAIADKLDLGDTATGVTTGLAALGGGIGGSVFGGRAAGGFQSPFARLNEFGASKPGISLLQRMKPAGRAAGALALLGGAGWLANKFMGNKNNDANNNAMSERAVDFAGNWNAKHYFDPNTPKFSGSGLRYQDRG